MNAPSLTDDQQQQLATLDELSDTDIDLSDIPDQGGKTGWGRSNDKMIHRTTLGVILAQVNQCSTGFVPTSPNARACASCG